MTKLHGDYRMMFGFPERSFQKNELTKGRYGLPFISPHQRHYEAYLLGSVGNIHRSLLRE